MADNSININHNVVVTIPGLSTGLTGGDPTGLSNESRAMMANQESMMKGLQDTLKNVSGLVDTVRQIQGATTNMLNSAIGPKRDPQEKQAEALDSALLKFEANRKYMSFKPGSSQSELLPVISKLEEYSKKTELNATETKDLTKSLKQFNELFKGSRLEIQDDRRERNRMQTGYNSFNMGELLVAAGGRAAGTYLSAEGAYQQSVIGATPGAIAQGRISADITERNAAASFMTALTTGIGWAAGSALSPFIGPAGPIVGMGLGYALGLPFQQNAAEANAREQSQYNVQVLSAMRAVTTGDYSRGIAQTDKSLLQKIGLSGIPDYYVTGSSEASSINAGGGRRVGAEDFLKIAASRYGMSSSVSAQDSQSMYNILAAFPTTDANQYASTKAFLSAKTGFSGSDLDMMVLGLSKATGMLPQDVASTLATLTSQTGLTDLGAASSFLAQTSRFGPAFQQAAISYQASGTSSQLAQEIATQGLFGVSMADVMSGNPAALRKLNSESGKFGYVDINGHKFSLGDMVLQSVAGVSTARSIRGAALAPGSSVGKVTPEQAAAIVPSANQDNGTINVTHATINVQGSTAIPADPALVSTLKQLRLEINSMPKPGAK